ncbi:ORF6C domain-containing protein [Bacillus inaquosorum]|uniref:BRO family protein n=1 Tax=Bacillus inaquosorum TaxID=483913 RepID=UPI0022826925|nr:BRO family protein [Bacillus inaquosorum]MCY8083248.1 ORF6C domain-containing protein [Bacillus inaquosorum]MCY8702025.1 ORF6C domain-containing protein [Bacillus inaquosorum]
MNQLQQVFNYQDQQVRTVVKDGQPWFVAKDVCNVLNHSNHKVAVSRLDEDEVSKVYLTDSLGRNQKTTVANEAGLYSLILTSNKPEAKQFKRWITHEVIPTIRKTGAYNQQPNYEQLSPELQHLIRMEQKQNEQDQRIGKLEDNLRIDSFQQNVIQKQIKVRVYQVYENISGEGTDIRKLFSSIHKNLRDAFGVPSYRDLRKLDFDEALAWVKLWRPLF